jgi:hypothetical protein
MQKLEEVLFDHCPHFIDTFNLPVHTLHHQVHLALSEFNAFSPDPALRAI